MTRLMWTIVATALYLIAAVAAPEFAAVLVPFYCFAVVLPYGISFCERRFRGYREHGDGDGKKS